MGMAYERTLITNTAIDGYGTPNLPNGVVYDDVFESEFIEKLLI